MFYPEDQNAKIKNYSFYILLFFIFLVFRLWISQIFFGGGDSTNVQSFSILNNLNINLYSITSPWPYLPLANSFLIFCDFFSNFLKVDTVYIYRFFTTLFDGLIASIIFFHHSTTKSFKKSFYISALYFLNPVSLIIVSILGFNDSIFIFFLILSILTLKKDKYNFISIILLSISISFKPVSIILLPFYIYKSKSSLFTFIFLIFCIFLNNLYYLFEFGIHSFLEIFSSIFYKMSSGHQISFMGIGFLNHFIEYKYIKLLTLLGIFFSLILYVSSIKINPIKFCGIVFISLILLRYNSHPQYFYWSIPLLFFTNYWKLVSIFSFFCGISIFSYSFLWNKNGSSYALLNKISENLTNSYVVNPAFIELFYYIYISFNILTIFVAVYIIGYQRLIFGINFVILFLKNLIFKIRIKNLFFYLFLYIFFLGLFSLSLDFSYLDFFEILKIAIFLFFPLLFIIILSSTFELINRYSLFFLSLCLFLIISLIFFNQNFKNYLIATTLIFLLINFKKILNSYFYNHYDER